MTDATWAPDGRFALSAAVDGTARVWDARNGDLLAILPHTGEVHIARFSPDGSRVVLAGPGGAAIHVLPRVQAGVLERVIRCQMPYEVQGDRLRPRAKDRRDCAPAVER